jgi:hypothetical protein
MNECIEWGGARNPAGYGRVAHKGKNALAHRVAYCAANGIEIERIRGLMVLHSCDNPGCVNPSHLRLGTHRDNMKDKVKRGRCVPAKGSSNGRAKLTEKDIPIIRRLLAEGKPQREIAKDFGVAQPQIKNIANGTRWRHV